MYVCHFFFMLDTIIYTGLRKDFMCLRSGCIVETESCESWDVGFPEVSNVVIKDASGMSGEHYSSGCHCVRSSMRYLSLWQLFLWPDIHISSLHSVWMHLILLLPKLSATFRGYCSIGKPSTASKMIPCFFMWGIIWLASSCYSVGRVFAVYVFCVAKCSCSAALLWFLYPATVWRTWL
jgi:hypothetical protein